MLRYLFIDGTDKNLVAISVDTNPIFGIAITDYHIHDITVIHQYSRLMTDKRIFLPDIIIYHKNRFMTLEIIPFIGILYRSTRHRQSYWLCLLSAAIAASSVPSYKVF